MNISLADQYYLKATDYYPFNLEQSIENLTYALGSDELHAPSNCMLGKIFMYQLKDYSRAAECFYNALKGDASFPDTYKYYSLLRMWEGEYARATEIINRGLKVKGMNISILLVNKAKIHEWNLEFKAAKAVLKQAQLYTVDECALDQMDRDLKRIKKKAKSKKPVLTRR